MTFFRPMIAAALLVGTVANAAPDQTREDKITKALAGRVAGQPTDCIIQHDIRSSEIIDQTAILYTMNNGTIFLNRPQSGANFLHRDSVLVTDIHTSQLCSIDIVRLYDTTSRMQMGSVGLGPFVPYRKPDRAS